MNFKRCFQEVEMELQTAKNKKYREKARRKFKNKKALNKYFVMHLGLRVKSGHFCVLLSYFQSFCF